MFHRIFPLFILLWGLLNLSAQENPIIPTSSKLNGKTVSFTELLEEMEQVEGWTIIQDVRVKFNYKIDKLKGMDYWFSSKTRKLHFRAQHIGLYNVTFDEEFWLVLDGATFEGHLSLIECYGVKAIFDNCTFKKSVRLHNNRIDFLRYDNSNFQGGFRLTRSEVNDEVNFVNSTFQFNDDLIDEGGGFDMDDKLFFISNKISAFDLQIKNCIFHTNSSLSDAQGFLNLSESRFKNLVIVDNNLCAPFSLSRSIIENYFELNNNQLNSVILDGFSYNSANSSVKWPDISNGRISVFDEEKGVLINKDYLIENKDVHLYDKMVGSYSTIFNGYKNQGNRQYANKVYIESKLLETDFLKINKQYGQYFLALFLNKFSDYGTNPVKTIYLSIYVIALFGLVYCMFPFEDPKPNRKTIQDWFFLYSEIERNPKLDVNESYNKFNSSFVSISRKDSVKKKISTDTFSGRILTLFHFDIGVIERFNTIAFSILEYSKKVRIPFVPLINFHKLLLIIYLIGTCFYHGFAKFFHSLFLSFNAFTTLGFGSLKVKGNLIYVTVIQGFIGWFCLSIFTVSLLNQIINW